MKAKLEYIQFYFTRKGIKYIVKWEPLGSKELQGIKYGMVYLVIVNGNNGSLSWETSLLANKSNSLLFIEKYITGSVI